MAYIDSTVRLVRPTERDSRRLWLDTDARRYQVGNVLRILTPDAITLSGELRANVPFELVVVREVVSPYSIAVDRAQYGTDARHYPPGSLLDRVADTVFRSERPVYHGFEDV
jgi:hypothetical protein